MSRRWPPLAYAWLDELIGRTVARGEALKAATHQGLRVEVDEEGWSLDAYLDL